LFMRRDIGFEIVSITSSSIGTSSDRDCLIVSQASMRATISRAVVRRIRSRIIGFEEE